MARDKEAEFWKSIVAGAVGAVAGLLAMNFYWQRVGPLLRNASQSQNGQEQGGQSDGSMASDAYPEGLDLDSIALFGKQYREQESATEALGRIVYTRVAGSEPQAQETKTLLSYLMHWGYGIFQGSVYGARRSDARFPDLSGGMGHAALLWLLGDELMVPLMGLQSGPTAVPPYQHANRLGAHLFYGAGTALATQLLRRLL